MTCQSELTQVIHDSQLGRWMVTRRDLWQIDLLDDRKLSSFAETHGLSLTHAASGAHVRQLWQLGLLHADLVTSTIKLHRDGLVPIGTDTFGRYLYSDERRPRRRARGWGSALAKLKPLPSKVELYFHPFRYYVLYHLDRMLKLDIHPMQALIAIERYPNVLEMVLSHFQRRTTELKFLEDVQEWNSVATLAIITEPFEYQLLFGSSKYSGFSTGETQQKRLEEHWRKVADCYRKLDVNQIEKARQSLCRAADLLDPNTEVYEMLRLTQGESRLKLKGSLGGALYLRTMAEILRRAAEEVFEIKLSEEDELGFSTFPSNFKEKMFGSKRLFDSNRAVANQFLRQFGLDYGNRIRWYIEGDTEYGAFESILGGNSGIELVNLKGEVIQKRGKGVAFRDSLRSDLNANIFSFVSIDGDNDIYTRAIQKAAKDDEICGLIFIAEPDFEFENFTLTELEQVLWTIAVENGASQECRDKLSMAIQGVKSGKELMARAKNSLPELSMVSKSREWGARLMHFAWQNPEMVNEPSGTTRTRQVVKAVTDALQSAQFGDYHYTRTKFKVDPSSGQLIKRT